MKVSVIIPCWNSESYIGASIRSVLEQSYSEIELIVINDGSTDRSAKEIENFGSSLKLININNSGACAARNVGILNATGDWIKFLDADDLLDISTIEMEYECLKKYLFSENVLVVSGSYTFFDDVKIRKLHWCDRLLSERLAFKINIADVLDSFPPVGSPLYSRRMLLGIGGFNQNLSNREDEDLFFRYMSLGVTPIYSGHFGYYYRQHNSPQRISLAPPVHHIQSQLQMLRSHVALTYEVRNINLAHSMLTTTSRRSWSYGRALVRAGFNIEAIPYFELSKSLGIKDCVAGSSIYKLFNSVIGPLKTEIFFQYIKK